MATFTWRLFLEQYSRDLLADRGIRKLVPEGVVQSGWMGFDPASSAELDDLERRLGAKLPDSYRQFLATSNGWRQSGGFIYEVFPSTKVEWFRTNNQAWIDAYTEPAQGMPPLSLEEHCVYSVDQDACRFRVEFLQSTLLISDVGDSAVYLLNPEIKTPAGEWEAWFFANWHAGAVRYRTFWDLMQAECRSMVELRDHDEQRYFPEDGIETLPLKLPGLIRELVEKVRSWEQSPPGKQQFPAYTKGIIEALKDAGDAAIKMQGLNLSADVLHGQLIGLLADLEQQWKAHVRPNVCGVDRSDGRAEGNREAAGIVSWFLNPPQS